MDTLALKITVTPLLMWLVSMIARRWGNLAGGLAAGLPITSGPISVYLALDNGADFAVAAAFSSLAGLATVSMTYVAYSWIARQHGVPLSALVAALAFIAWSLLLQAMNSLSASIIITIIAMALLMHVTRPRRNIRFTATKHPTWDMPARIGASLILVLGVTYFADAIGPSASGFLSPIPIVAWPLIVFAHAQGGSHSAQSAIRGTSIGIPSVFVFYAFVLLHLDKENLILTYTLAFLLSTIGVIFGVGLLRISATRYDKE